MQTIRPKLVQSNCHEDFIWPCLVLPVKAGIPGSPVMKWGAMVESVRNDIEGILASSKYNEGS